MHDDTALVERRIRRELHERVVPAMYREAVPLAVEAWDVPGEPVPFAEAVAAEYRPFAVGSKWSRPWGTTWFRCRADVPAGWVGPSLEAVIDLGFHPDAAGFQCEGLVWWGGEPLQGVHPRRMGVPFPQVGAGPLEFFVEAASNPSFPSYRPSPLGSLATAGDRPLYTLRRADLAVRDDTVFHLLLDVEVLLELMAALAPADPRRQRLLRQLEAAFDALDLTDVAGTAASARSELEPALALPARASAHRVIGVGHAHIDSAWLWPVRETERKCARTFASAVRLMDDYPEYRFVCSQAAQYAWIEQQHPGLFQRIRGKVAAGQWQPVGGMWVESDMNLPSGESIVRQFVHGQRWFEQRFGVRCREVWIPDVFGYPASLPQIFRAAGCTRFVTQKLSWNQQNRFPHSTFLWRGLDGSDVLTHFPPVDTYNATVSATEMVYAERNFKEHGWSDWSLMPFGHGNGGGGPTREMLERARRMADLDGAPRIAIGTTDEFFAHVEDEVAAGGRVPVWDGELYFEMHRGTLTSQTRTKTGNRLCERLLREAELWWAAGGDVPSAVAAELDGLWKAVLLQQFHDIIPGSSIAWVHADAEAAHARVAARLDELIGEALARLAPPVPAVANASHLPRTEVVDGPDGPVAVHAAPMEVAPLVAVELADRVTVTEHSMANGHLAVSWDLEGRIVSVIDARHGRELLPPGRAVELHLAPDHPVEYDAWDLEQWTTRQGTPVGGVTSVEVVEAGPLRARLQVLQSFGRSQAVVTATLRAGSPRLDLTVEVDWHEDEQYLSLMIPLDVHARDAACDTQFGQVLRPTHASTSWDAAKFEVCAHRYVDLAEAGWGVAVLNDGRYGHGLLDGGVRVSLLRAPKYPDPTADQGRHRVTVSLLPHGPGVHEVLAEAEALNLPLRLLHSGGVADRPALPPVHIDHPGVGVTAVKRADDGSGDLVVRLYEACGDRAAVTVRCPYRIGAASLCNLLEEPHTALDVADGIVVLHLRPFELATLRLSASGAAVG